MARALKRAARRAYRLNPKMLAACEVALSLTLQNIDHLKRQLKQLDKVICRKLEAIPQTLTSVKGLGPISAAGIIAEILEGVIIAFFNPYFPKFHFLVLDFYRGSSLKITIISL
ncbi:MAG: transposase [Eubacteriales bacterium]|nr:transposase [Eubacteriales bacterium]MDN5364404.1 transposase [Eubacteriales bacterium]